METNNKEESIQSCTTSPEVATQGEDTPEQGKPSPKAEGKDIGILTVVLVSFMMSALSVFCYDYFFSPRIVVADLEGYMMSMKKAAETGQIGVEQIGAGLDQVKKTLDQLPKKDVILLSSVVLRPQGLKIVQMPPVPQGQPNSPPVSAQTLPGTGNMANGLANPAGGVTMPPSSK